MFVWSITVWPSVFAVSLLGFSTEPERWFTSVNKSLVFSSPSQAKWYVTGTLISPSHRVQNPVSFDSLQAGHLDPAVHNTTILCQGNTSAIIHSVHCALYSVYQHHCRSVRVTLGGSLVADSLSTGFSPADNTLYPFDNEPQPSLYHLYPLLSRDSIR